MKKNGSRAPEDLKKRPWDSVSNALSKLLQGR